MSEQATLEPVSWQDWELRHDNGNKGWRIETPDFTLQPVGRVTALEARQVCVAILKALRSTSAATAPAIKPLEWTQNWPSDPLTGYATVEPLNRYYVIDHDGPRFYARSALHCTEAPDQFIGNYGTFDKAKAACQADFEARIRAVLA